ncbi:MAG: hypothetical protein ABIK68_07240, partial [bacterium]
MKNNPEQSDAKRQADASVPIDLELISNVKEAMAIPSSHKNPFWELQAVDQDEQKKQKFLGIFKRRTLKEDEVKELRTEVVQAPGNTRVKLKKLRKKYPDNGLLLMLSATATYGMVLNSSNKDTSLTGYKMAVKEAATALLSNQI